MSEPAIVDDTQAGWLFGANLFRLRVADPNIIDPRYLLGFLTLSTTKQWIRRRAETNVVPTISTRMLGELIVTVPPIKVQRRISAALLILDQQITVHREYIEAATSARTAFADELMTGTSTLQ